jgi:hypothetical protein
MVTLRTETLVFTKALATHDEDGYATNRNTATLSLLCRPEPMGGGRKIAAPNGDLVECAFKVFADPFTTTLTEGYRTTVRGKEVEVIKVHRYQKHVEIWLG